MAAQKMRFEQILPQTDPGLTVEAGDSVAVTWFCWVGTLNQNCPSNLIVSWEAGGTPAGFSTVFVPPTTSGSNFTTEIIYTSPSTSPGTYLLSTAFTCIIGNAECDTPWSQFLVTVVVKNPPNKAAIANTAQLWYNNANYDGSYGAPCSNACVASVEALVHQATGKYIGSSSITNTDALKASGSINQISQSSAVPGDLMIVDSANGKDAHVGVCMDAGCHDVKSNSSSNCTFTFDSPNDARFTYPNSPYIGGTATYWSISQ